ncbi:hypothetical protein ES707_20002 [subsurface metagenome]
MRQKRRRTHPAGPRVRPYDPADVDKIAVGIERGMQLAGYDYPVRKLRKTKAGCCVTLPMQVRNYLGLEYGDWLAFGSTPWLGLAAFVRVTTKQYEAIAVDGRKEFRKLARKIPKGKGQMFVRIPLAIRKILSAEVGDFLIFGLTPADGVISLCAIKGGGDSAGIRRTG